jgi:putative ABC transport system permease protein
MSAIREQIWALDSDMPIAKVATMDRLLNESVAQPGFHTFLLATFASVALMLATAGIYGVISYSTKRRAHEIGVRMALGAQARDVIKLIVRQGMTLAVMGVAIGVGAALVLTRLMSSLLYGVSATDPVTFSAVALSMACVALLACWIPARRATKADPMAALRCE